MDVLVALFKTEIKEYIFVANDIQPFRVLFMPLSAENNLSG